MNTINVNEYLTDLIERMDYTNDHIVGSDSSSHVSSKAYQEARAINNLDFVSQLITFLEKERNKSRRTKAYIILGCIAQNTNNPKTVDYLIRSLNRETDKHVLSSLLGIIENLNKPVGTYLEPLIEATKNEKWLIRYAAIMSLNNSADAIAEETLIEIINTSTDANDIIYSNAVLNKIGTLRAIPHLTNHLKSRKRDVKGSAEYAIEAIRKRAITIK